jgi:glutathione synthase/RimK-type ligase-like ATP-grasp enzyme
MKVPYVGILLNQSMYSGIPYRKTQTEVLAFYEEGARLYGVKPCYLRLEDLRPGQGIVPAYVKQGEKYERVTVPLPRVIHNRALLFSARARHTLARIMENQVIVFNQWNRYSKLYIHSLLWTDLALRPHLPHTVSGTVENVKRMMKRYDALFIKPNSGSIGFGIMHLMRVGRSWKWSYAVWENGRKRWRNTVFSGNLPALLIRKLHSRRYHIQEALPLATHRGNPFDLRVSVQKDVSGTWQVTGMAGKVAPAGRFLSNVGQGGKVQRLSTLLTEYPHLDETAVKQTVSEFALRVVRKLEESIPGLADVGLDIGITREGTPLFIECNGRDQRYAFRNARMMKEWKATYANPMGYAAYLLEKMKEKE